MVIYSYSMGFSAKNNSSFELFIAQELQTGINAVVIKDYCLDDVSFEAKIVMLVLLAKRFDAIMYG